MKTAILFILGITAVILFIRFFYELGYSYYGRKYDHKYGISLLFVLAALILVACLMN